MKPPGSPTKPVSEQEGSDWERAFRINLFGMMYAMKHQIRRFQEQKTPGAIVNTASMSRFFTPPGYAPYVASKAAVEGLSLTLAAELAADDAQVGVTVLHPGAVRTNIKASLRNRPAGSAGGLVDFDIAQKIVDDDMWIGPEEAGAIVVRAVRNGDRYAFTHPGMRSDVRSAFDAVLEGMDKYT